MFDVQFTLVTSNRTRNNPNPLLEEIITNQNQNYEKTNPYRRIRSRPNHCHNDPRLVRRTGHLRWEMDYGKKEQ
jgi:hypothetical protein